MMNEYNRSDPFMYLMEKSQQIIEGQIKNVIKNLLIEAILFIISSISIILYGVITKNWIFVSIFQLYQIVLFCFSIFLIGKCARYTKKKDIQNMILSDVFRDINLNTEKVLMDTLIIHEGIGVAKISLWMIRFCISMHVVSILFSIINLLT